MTRILTAVLLCLSAGLSAQQAPAPPAGSTPTPAGQTATPTPPAAPRCAPTVSAPPATPAAPVTPAAAAAAAATPKLLLTGDVGIVFFTVRAEGAGDFEAFLNKVKEAMAQGAKPEHKDMAAGWTFFKVTEGSTAAQLVYASVMMPAVLTCDYDPVKILNDLMPADAAAMYPKFKDAIVSVNRLNLASAIKMAP